MDGEAIQLALSCCPGPDCFKSVIPALGLRLKVYRSIKAALEKEEQKRLEESVNMDDDPLLSPEASYSRASSFSTPPFQQPDDGIFESRSSNPVPIKSPSTCGSVASTGTKESKPFCTPKSSKVKGNLPDPFPIPLFRKHTQKNLELKKIADDDRRHMVSVLGHVVCAHLERASMRDCKTVAEALVRTYPFLSETHSWQHFLYTKCQNINRTPGSKHEGSCDYNDPKPKRSKIDDGIKHCYPSVDDLGDDDVSNEHNKHLLDSESKKVRPDKNILLDLMKRTSTVRRKWILNDEVKMVKSICQSWPLLKKYTFVVLEFSLIMKKESGFKDLFFSSWEIWGKAIKRYAQAIKSPPNSLKHALRSSDDDDLTSLRCWAHFLTLKKKGKENVEEYVDIPFILWDKPCGTPPRECIDTTNNQPFILKLSDCSDDVHPQYFIVIEQELLIECSTLVDALFALFAVHYVQYHSRLLDFYVFIEEKIANIKPSNGKRSPTYMSVTAAAQCYQDKLN